MFLNPMLFYVIYKMKKAMMLPQLLQEFSEVKISLRKRYKHSIIYMLKYN